MNYPEVVTQTVENNVLTLQLEVSPQLEAFNGHFDSFPIIPGVVQVQWALHFFKGSPLYTQTALPNTAEHDVYCSKMSALKFQQVIPPNSRVTLTLSFDEIKQCLIFSISDGDTKYSSGKLFLSQRN
ncbi:thioester dehydrase [Kangiella japonica]|uniref:Thioester dehydrase n=1 Tax=Kangiella japonica TaxID=647384 RepID=A0ABN0T0W5_9GAMM